MTVNLKNIEEVASKNFSTKIDIFWR
jgi:hypothetical protein